MKRHLRKITRLFGYDLTKLSDANKPPKAAKPAPVSRAVPINVFPLVVEDLLERLRLRGRGPESFFFVQIGAHDGVHGDHVRPFVDKYHWKGVLVEPQPEIYRQLVANYAGESQLIFENVAISAEDGEATLYTFKKDASLPEHASMLASFNRNALVNNGHGYKGEIEELKVPALTLSTLLTRRGIKEVHLLQIDTEGYDFEIIKMIGPSEVLPAVIHFESAFMNAEQKFECNELLHDLGYRVLTIGIDTIAYRQEDDGFDTLFANKGY